MDIVLIGLSHKTAPVGMRELLAFGESDLRAALAEISRLEGVSEALLLCTCNRTEVYCIPAAGCDPSAAVVEWLRAKAEADVLPYLYQRSGADAVFHLFRVASSLDSLVLGEPQILGQVKKAFSLACEHGAAGSRSKRIFSRAFKVAKRVRSETRVGECGVSVAYVAVELAKRVFADLAGRTVLLVGAGKTSELAARHLREAGVSRFFVANRSPKRAEALASKLDGEARTLDDVPSLLSEVDMVLSSTGAPGILVTREQVARAVKERRYRPLFFVDLSVPRDIDPAANELANVYIYDLDDLEKVAEENREQRKCEADRAERIVELELAELMAERRVREVAPVIAAMQRKASSTADAEVERTWARLAAMGVPEEGRAALGAMAKAIVKKLLHSPTCSLKAACESGEAEDLVSAATLLFGLEDASEALGDPRDVPTPAATRASDGRDEKSDEGFDDTIDCTAPEEEIDRSESRAELDRDGVESVPLDAAGQGRG